MDREIVHYLMDIKERLGTIETKLDSVAEASMTHEVRVAAIETKQTKQDATLKTLKWMSGVLFMAIPATAAAIAKILKP